MLPLARSGDGQSAHTDAVPQVGGVAEAGHLLVAWRLHRRLLSLCALQGLFSFIRNSLETHIAMA